MHRFFLTSVPCGVDEIPLSPEDARKICRVLRLVPGDEIIIWDAAGSEYSALITRVAGLDVYVRILEEREQRVESPLCLNLVQGIPKGDKIELVIQKATELGARRIFPVVTERTVVHVPLERRPARLQRWQTIAREAARQCGRVLIPEIAAIRTLNELWDAPEPEAIKLICWEQETGGLKAYLRNTTPSPRASVYLFVGPEGGFTSQEVANGIARGGVPVSLGPRILRTETAGLVGLSLVLYEWGDLGGL